MDSIYILGVEVVPRSWWFFWFADRSWLGCLLDFELRDCCLTFLVCGLWWFFENQHELKLGVTNFYRDTNLPI